MRTLWTDKRRNEDVLSYYLGPKEKNPRTTETAKSESRLCEGLLYIEKRVVKNETISGRRGSSRPTEVVLGVCANGMKEYYRSICSRTESDICRATNACAICRVLT